MSNPFEYDYDLDRLERITAKYFGIELLVPPRFVNHFKLNEYEAMTARLVRQMSKGVDGFIDVGAHIGFYSLLVGDTNRECKLYAFEPVPQNYQILKKNLSLHDLQARVYQVAVSNQDGRSDFQISVASDNSGFVANPNGAISGTIPLDVMKLDSLLDDIDADSLMIKIDTEGNEIQVLDGMKGIVSEISDLRLFIEFNPQCLEVNGSEPDELLSKLYELGLDVFVIHDGDMYLEKLAAGSDWRQILGQAAYKNLYCVKSDKSLNICVFSHSAQMYGAEKTLLELSESLLSNYGALSTVILPEEGPLQAALMDIGVSIVHSKYSFWCANEEIAAEEVASYMAESVRQTIYLDSTLRKIAPDVVVSNSLVIPWGALSASRLNYPHVWLVREFGVVDHGYEFFIPFESVLSFVTGLSNHVFVLSEALKSELFPDCSSDQCTIARPANIAIQNVDRIVQDRVFKIEDSFKLLMLGRITGSKGQGDAVRATLELLQRGHNVELAIVGHKDSSYASELQDFVRQSGAEDRIHFVDHTENVRSIVETADIGLTCSRNEAFGRITVEYLLAGKPVIGTNTGGTAEIIDPGVNGYLYDPGNVNQLVEKVESFIKDPDKLKKFGDHASERVREMLQELPDDELTYRKCLQLKGASNPHPSPFFHHLLQWQNQVYGYKFDAVDAFKKIDHQLAEYEPESYADDFEDIFRVLEGIRLDQEHRYADIKYENDLLKYEMMTMRATLSWQLLETIRGMGFAGILRKIVRKLMPKPKPPEGPVYDEVDVALGTINSIQDKTAPLDLEIIDSEPRVNIVIPMIDFRYVFGGYIGVFNLALALDKVGFNVRFVIIDQCDFKPEKWRTSIKAYQGLEELFDHVEVSYHFDRSKKLQVSEHDRFLAISAWTAYVAFKAAKELGQERFVYLTQEYEPLFHDAGSIYNIVNKSYDLPHYAIYSSDFYYEYARMNRIGVFADDDGEKNAVVIKNAVPRSTVTLRRLENHKDHKLLVYARPEPHAHRNMFEFSIMALRAALWEGIFDKETWSFWGIGTIRHGKKSIPLIEDVELKLLKRVSLKEYIDLLPDYDVGLSLMASPHPSLPPLDMASAGMLTVTNTFANKTKDKLTSISPNLIPVSPAVDEIKNGLAEAVSRVDGIESRMQGTNIDWPRTWEETFSPPVMKKITRFIGEALLRRRD